MFENKQPTAFIAANPPLKQAAIGAARITVDLTLTVGDGGSPVPLRVTADGTSLFDGDAWESELVWLLVNLLRHHLARETSDIQAALTEALKRLK